MTSSAWAEARTVTLWRRKWSQTFRRAMVNSQARKLALPASKDPALLEIEIQVSWCRSSAASPCARPSIRRMNTRHGRS